jgi:excisionase family DNA binding protein
MGSDKLDLPNGDLFERWLSIDEIAAHLGMSKVTIYKWVETRKIPGHKVGRIWRFRASEVDTWVINGGANNGTSVMEKSNDV